MVLVSAYPDHLKVVKKRRRGNTFIPRGHRWLFNTPSVSHIAIALDPATRCAWSRARETVRIGRSCTEGG
jgi:hypothetical protein